MRFKKISSLLEYSAWLLEKFNYIKQVQENNIYRIIEIKQLTSNQYKLIVQVIGKSSIIESSPQEIVTCDRLLEGFSKKDVRTITYLACEQIKKPKYKIIMQDFCKKFNKMMFRLKEAKSEILVIKTADQILMDKNLIHNLSRDDINSISYIAGYESLQNEKFLKKNTKKNS